MKLDRFEQIKATVGKTPVYEISRIAIPNGNRIFAKEEYRNSLTGSHYDRVYVHLIEVLEKSKGISPNTVQLIETTSGNAGEAFAATAQALGYQATVVIPENTPKSRLAAIKSFGAELETSPAHLGVKGAQLQLKRLLAKSRKQKSKSGLPLFCPDHSRDLSCLDAIASLATEVLEQSSEEFDYFVAAIGNGLSILGPARHLKNNGLEIIGWDPIQAPRGYELKYPGRFEEKFGFKAGDIGSHRILGTGVLDIDFPFLDSAIIGREKELPVVNEITIVIDDDAIRSVSKLVDENKLRPETLLEMETLPNLTNVHMSLLEIEMKPVGPSSAGSLAVALDMCKRVQNRNILTIFYDHIRSYV